MLKLTTGAKRLLKAKKYMDLLKNHARQEGMAIAVTIVGKEMGKKLEEFLLGKNHVAITYDFRPGAHGFTTIGSGGGKELPVTGGVNAYVEAVAAAAVCLYMKVPFRTSIYNFFPN